MLAYMNKTQRHEMDAWLGDDHGLTDEQVTDLMRISDQIDARYCTPDADVDDPEMVELDLAQASEGEREAALTVAYRLMVERPDTVVGELAGERQRAQLAEARALAGLRQAALTLIEPGGKGARGVSTAKGFADRAYLNRMTVLDWLGLR